MKAHLPLDDWFHALADSNALPPNAACALSERGFVVLPGPVPTEQMERLARAYDDAVASASGDDVKAGSATTRVDDFVNRGADFDALYVFAPLLMARAGLNSATFNGCFRPSNSMPCRNTSKVPRWSS